MPDNNSKIEEDILAGPLAAFLQEAVEAGLPERCFFLRYSDPDPHLRLRFHTPTADDVGLMLPEVCALDRSLLDQGLCSRFALDTYEREIERYGGPEAMQAAEDLFVTDSALVLEMFRFLKITGIPREVLTVITALDLLEGLGLENALLSDLTSRFKTWRQEAGAAYRKLKTTLLPLVEDLGRLDDEPGGRNVLRLMDRRRAVAAEAGRQLQRLNAEGRLIGPLADICHSYLHMHCNRLVGRDRAQERQVLGLMVRARQARQARCQSVSKEGSLE